MKRERRQREDEAAAAGEIFGDDDSHPAWRESAFKIRRLGRRAAGSRPQMGYSGGNHHTKMRDRLPWRPTPLPLCRLVLLWVFFSSPQFVFVHQHVSINCLSTQWTELPGHFIHRCPKPWHTHTHTRARARASAEPGYKRQILTLRSIGAIIRAGARLLQCKKVTSSTRVSESRTVKAEQLLGLCNLLLDFKNNGDGRCPMCSECGAPSDQRPHWENSSLTKKKKMLKFLKLTKKERKVLKMPKKYWILSFFSSQFALHSQFLCKGNLTC